MTNFPFFPLMLNENTSVGAFSQSNLAENLISKVSLKEFLDEPPCCLVPWYMLVSFTCLERASFSTVGVLAKDVIGDVVKNGLEIRVVQMCSHHLRDEE